MGLFDRKEKVLCTVVNDGHGELFDVEPEVYDYIRRLEWDLIEEKNKTIRAESERDAAKRELETVLPIIKDERFEPAISAGCEECKYAVRSPFDRRLLGCRRKMYVKASKEIRNKR